MIVPNIEYPEKWTFGTFFLQIFNVLFDYENSQINFHSNKIRINVDTKALTMNDDLMITKYVIKICFFYLSIILFIQTFLLTLSKNYFFFRKQKLFL